MAKKKTRKQYTWFTDSMAKQAHKLMMADRDPWTVKQLADHYGVCLSVIYSRVGPSRRTLERREAKRRAPPKRNRRNGPKKRLLTPAA